MGAKIRDDANIVKRAVKRLGEILGPDIDDEKDDNKIEEGNGLTQEQRDILNKGIDEARRQEREFEDFQRRIQVPNKDQKIIIKEDENHNVTRNVVGKEQEAKEEETIDISL